MNLDKYRKNLEKITADEPAPEDRYFLWNETQGGSWYSDFCWDCADMLCGWLAGEVRMITYFGYSELPFRWEGMKIEINRCHDTNSDSIRLCEMCGCRLEYSLTEYGIRSELDYFEESGIDNSDAFDLLTLIESVESDSPEYERTIRLLNGYL